MLGLKHFRLQYYLVCLPCFICSCSENITSVDWHHGRIFTIVLSCCCTIYFCNYLTLLTLKACMTYNPDAYVCKLVRRWHPSAGMHRWSMPTVERCHCQAVVAPKERNPPRNCPLVRGDLHDTGEFWYTDAKKNITSRINWNPIALNKLLERAEYCSEYDP